MNSRIGVRRVLTALLLAFAAAAHGAPAAQAILAASDKVRNPSKPFSVVITLTEYRHSKQTGSNTLSVLS
jgi:hypothetical protein